MNQFRKKIRVYLLLTVVSAFMWYAFPVYVVASGSMEPEIAIGSRVIAVRNSFIWGEIEKKDVLVFSPCEGISKYPWIHQVTAVEGDRYESKYDMGRVDVLGSDNLSIAKFEVGQIPKNMLYQSGIAENSYHGLIGEEKIIARVVVSFSLPWD